MAESLARRSDAELERALIALGAALAVPDPVDVAPAVVELLEGARGDKRDGAADRFRAHRPLRPVAGVEWRRVALAAAAVVVLVAGTLVVSPGARRAVAGWLGLRGERITVIPSPVSPAPVRLGAGLNLGRGVSIEEAQRGVRFTLLLPHQAELGPPDEVYLGTGIPGGQVTFLYRARSGLPEAATTGTGLLLTEFRASIERVFIEKMVGAGTTIQSVTVHGEPGFWIAGAPHDLLYRDPEGAVIPDSVRLAGNVLVWQRGEVTLRIEGLISRAVALGIAGSVG